MFKSPGVAIELAVDACAITRCSSCASRWASFSRRSLRAWSCRAHRSCGVRTTSIIVCQPRREMEYKSRSNKRRHWTHRCRELGMRSRGCLPIWHGLCRPGLTFDASKIRRHSKSTAKFHNRNWNMPCMKSLHVLFDTEVHVHDRGMLHVNHCTQVREKIGREKKRNVTRNNLNSQNSAFATQTNRNICNLCCFFCPANTTNCAPAFMWPQHLQTKLTSK